MRKILGAVIFSFLLALVFPKAAFAQNDFKTYLATTYDVGSDGKAVITQNVTLENQYANLYATSYALTLDGLTVSNPKAFQDGRTLQVDRTEDSGKVTLKINFDDAVVGKGKRRVFSIVFADNSIVTKTGEVWELLIPRINADTTYESYTVTINTPKSFGELAYISPEHSSKNPASDINQYIFSNDSEARNGISAAFGQFQVFDFNLIYHLENPLARSSQTQIAIPPDSAFQKVNYKQIDPAPENVIIDPDGNWLATYNLRPRQRIDIKASGSVQLFASARQFSPPQTDSLNSNLLGNNYWQTSDPQIAALANKLKTPRAIYDYVTSALSYDYNRVQPNVQRLGATAALENPKSAICTEYTDLFVAIARAAGIPAREVEGYAYTENPQIQPLSLVADVLHAWPEYWDKDKKAWMPIDPTWGSTTGGIDFFNKLDLRHFAFVVHGADPIKPYPPGSYKLGSNPQKDVFVSFGKLPIKRTSIPEIQLKTSGGLLFFELRLFGEVRNPGPIGLYAEKIKIYYDANFTKEFTIPALPVGGKYDFDFDVPYGFFGRGTPDKVTVSIGTQSKSMPTNKLNFVIANVSIALIIIFGLTFLLFLKIRTILRMKKTYAAKFGRKNKDSSR